MKERKKYGQTGVCLTVHQSYNSYYFEKILAAMLMSSFNIFSNIILSQKVTEIVRAK